MFYKLSDLSNAKRRIAISLLSLIGITVAFIFIQSMLSREISGAESGAVREFLEEFFSYSG